MRDKKINLFVLILVLIIFSRLNYLRKIYESTSSDIPTESVMTASRTAYCPYFGELYYDNIQPKYRTDEKYLSHYLTHGTVNQIMDFRSGIYFNIILNRTLITPLFWPSNSNKYSYIYG